MAAEDVCSVRGCEWPVFFTAEKLCREHVLKRHIAPNPPEDPFADIGKLGGQPVDTPATVTPSTSGSATSRPRATPTPKEQ